MTTAYIAIFSRHDYPAKALEMGWNRELLAKKYEDDINVKVQEIELPPIIDAVRMYFDRRGLVYAVDPVDALMFLTSEIGELSDAIVHNRGEWVRNHDKERDAGPEIGDVLMMLCVTADRLNTEPLDEMLKKFAKKGYPINEQH